MKSNKLAMRSLLHRIYQTSQKNLPDFLSSQIRSLARVDCPIWSATTSIVEKTEKYMRTYNETMETYVF